jgi:predicted metalloendopeptidase
MPAADLRTGPDVSSANTDRLYSRSSCAPSEIGKFRAIGPLSNLPEFQKAFGCKPGSLMFRAEAERCDVW